MKKFSILFLCFLSVLVSAQSFNPGLNNYPSEIIEYSAGIFYFTGTTNGTNGNKSDNIIVTKINFITNTSESMIFGDEFTDRGYGIEKLGNGNLLLTGESWKTFNKWGRENAFLMELDTNLNKVWAKAYYLFNRDGGLACQELSNGNFILTGYSRSVNVAPASIGDVLVIETTPEGDTLFQKAINSAGNDYGFDVLELPSGNILIMGESSGFFNSNQADYRFAHDADLLFIELNQAGNELRRKLWGGDGHELARKIIKAPGNDGFLIVGSTQSYGEGNFDVFLLKIDNDLHEIWHKTYGDKNIDYGNSFALSTTGDTLFLACTTTNEISGMPQSTIICTDINGNIFWKKDYAMDTLSFSSDIIAQKTGGCVLAGYGGPDFDQYKTFVLNINEDGEEIATYPFNFEIVAYPNPVKWGNKLHFKIMPPRHTKVKDYVLAIYDVSGQTLDRIDGKGKRFSYDTRHLKRGIYIYKFYADNFVISGKFVVF